MIIFLPFFIYEFHPIILIKIHFADIRASCHIEVVCSMQACSHFRFLRVPPTFCASFRYFSKRRDGADIQIEEHEVAIASCFMNGRGL